MKYILTKKTIEVCGRTLFQIKATASFGSVDKGELGGYIEKEENLSQWGNAWVSGDAQVYGNAWVYGDARVYGNAQVYGDARVYGDAQVYGKIKISLGYFFGMRYNKEEIKYKENEGAEIIYKGEAKFDDEIEKTIKIGNQIFDKKDVEERLKGIKPIDTED